ncbi:MAG: hypothetical protein COV72_09160 [Candidatus Omnitrophica bacterium CG11_big_fil_rev_8_21_14_0_20_42_13]|uniref:Riboflavin biosynthesis protein n=1 Tax=Candidatus Ghiorseimicrobium undicola TaxID=1974746 RepID=A0A2H0LV60_9BACT|nr:MAG: hypothetical protein COV72_09160 [Candidatus Omnitrophica bacterium CG11_big_fil_rev_8_21_14_0_20_42_13]
MKVIYGLGNKAAQYIYNKPCVALGIFDGVHLGHRHVLASLVREAKKTGKEAVCITFFPHPLKILSSKNIFIHLVSLPHRLKLIQELGVDVCIVINFNRDFARIRPEEFIKILADVVKPYAIFVGSNFTFGRAASGDIKLLKKLAKKFNFKVRDISPLKLDGKIISSTLIRGLIKEGNLILAKKYLGRNISILGRVIKGKSVGRRLGYHTANIDTEGEVIPPAGVYAVKVKLVNPDLYSERFAYNKKYYGIAYIGTSPTMKFHYRLNRLEVYIFNFKANIYNKLLEAEFIAKIREEVKFSSLELLAAQIKKDVNKAKHILTSLF